MLCESHYLFAYVYRVEPSRLSLLSPNKIPISSRTGTLLNTPALASKKILQEDANHPPKAPKAVVYWSFQPTLSLCLHQATDSKSPKTHRFRAHAKPQACYAPSLTSRARSASQGGLGVKFWDSSFCHLFKIAWPDFVEAFMLFVDLGGFWWGGMSSFFLFFGGFSFFVPFFGCVRNRSKNRVSAG